MTNNKIEAYISEAQEKLIAELSPLGLNIDCDVTIGKGEKGDTPSIEHLEDAVGESLANLAKEESIRQSNEITRVSNEKQREDSELKREQEENKRKTQEQDRVTKEKDRVIKENERKANETNRISEEGKRKTSENARVAAETNRVNKEAARASSEETRIANENARKAEEGKRVTQENQRKANEENRISEENKRKSNETLRQSQETSRVAKEVERVAKESERVASEVIRISSEKSRVLEEAKRVSQESARASAEDTRKSQESIRVREESKRATEEEKRAINEADRVSSETSRKTEEGKRVTAENTRVSNENTRKSSEVTRTKAEVTRVSSENTRVSSENTRKTNETNRQNAEASRVSEEEKRRAKESLRIVEENIRIENDRNRKDTFDTIKTDANAISAEMRELINNFETGDISTPEIMAARVDAGGKIHSSIGNRMLSDHSNIEAKLRTKANVDGSLSQNFKANTLTVEKILPARPGAIDLGDANNRFRAMYVDEAYLSTNTLYLGDTPILGTNQDTIMIKADPDQSINMKTSGVGTTKITSNNNVEMSTSGMNANVVMQATGANSQVNIGATSSINLNAPDIKLNGKTTVDNMTIKGNLNIQGSMTSVETTDLQVKDNMIEINKGETGSGVSAGRAGLRVNRGQSAYYNIMFDEADDLFKVGMDNNLETIATRPYVNTTVAPKADKTYVDGELAKKSNNHSHPYASDTHLNVKASASTLGHIKSGGDLTIDANGIAQVNDNSHNHTIANVSGLQSELNTKATTTYVNAELAKKSPVHSHPYEPANVNIQQHIASSHLALGETSATAYRGDRGKTAYDHSQATHAPSSAQKNSDITKAEIEAKLTGTINTHTHNFTNLALGETSTTAYRGDRGKIAYDHSQMGHAPASAQKNSDITKAEIEAKLTGGITSHTHSYLPLSGGNLTGNMIFSADSKIEWSRNTDWARIYFKNTADSDADSYMHFVTGDNGNEYFKFSMQPSSSLPMIDVLTIKQDHLRFKNNPVYHTGYKPTKSDVGLASVDNTADSSKNVLSATKLTTPRKINGIDFDGTKDIVVSADSWEVAYKEIPAKSNLNNYLTGGHFSSGTDGNSSTILNRPPGTFGFALEVREVWRNTDLKETKRVIQVAYMRNINEIYTRSREEDLSWSAWKHASANTWRGIQDNLTSTSTTESLSANQGKILKGLVDSKAPSTGSTNINKLAQTVTFGDGGMLNIVQNDSSWWQKISTVDTENKAVHRFLFSERQGSGDYVELFGVDGNGEIYSKNRKVYHTGNKPTPTEIGAAREYKTLQSYDGFVNKNGNDNGWIRTTQAGMIPYSSGNTTSSLGSADWQFKNIYGTNIFENGSKIVDKYSQKIDTFMRRSQIDQTHNWNSIKTAGSYKVQMPSWGATSLNGPNSFIPDLYNFGVLLVYQTIANDSENRTVQIYMPHRHENSHPIVMRMSNGDGWKPWSKIGRGLTHTDVGAAAASHGVHLPTGGANGQFLGWASNGAAKWVSNPNTWRGVQDNVTSTATDQSLSANQGKVLKGLVDGKAPAGHGLGTYAASIGNADTDLRGKSGFYNGHNVIGAPSGGHGWKYYFNAAHSNPNGYNGTIAMDFNGSVLAFRAVCDGLVKNWNYVYHTGNKPTATDVGLGSVNNTADSAKNVLSATKLQTPRTINGVSFDGTANIVTSNITAPSSITLRADSDSSSTGEYASIKAGHNELKITSSAGGATVTQGQDKLTFNGHKVYHAGSKPTAADVGAAPSSHNHDDRYFTESEINTKMLGNITNHKNLTTEDLDTIKSPGFYSQSANVNTSADRHYPENLAGSLMVTIGAGIQQAYHVYNSSRVWTRSQYGTGAWTTWAKEYNTLNKPSVADIGAAASSHTHSYLPLAGGNITGSIGYSGGGYTGPVIHFKNGDANGAGLALGAGGYTAIGSGESAIAMMNNVNNPSVETLVLSSDNDIIIATKMQDGYASRVESTISAHGNLNMAGSITVNKKVKMEYNTATESLDFIFV